MKKNKVPFAKINQPSAFEFFERFKSEKIAMKYMESARWPAGIRCLHCGHPSVYRIRAGKLFTCKSCRKQFTLRTGTVMEGSHVPIRKWLYAMYLVSTSRKGISSIQLAKEIGITQKSAWFVLGRLREACRLNGQVNGIVEIDETYIGGKEKNKHFNKRLNAGRGTIGKSIVMGVRSRAGHVRAQVVENTNRNTMHSMIEKNVAKGSTLFTDEHPSYEEIQGYNHERVNHSAHEYVNGEVHTNSIESVWALIKRGHYGTFHHWSAKHLQSYIQEFVFRMNTRSLPAFDKNDKVCGINFIRLMVANMEGKRLTYKALISDEG